MILYFIEGRPSMNAAALAATPGLAHLVGARHCSFRGVTGTGPGGAGGCVFTVTDAEPNLTRLLYQKADQVWHPLGGAPGLYVGWWKDTRPGPETLARPDRVPGYDVRMGDGRLWHVPCARPIRDSPCPGFPRALTRDADGPGWVVGGVVEQYADLYAKAETVFKDMTTIDEAGQVTFSDGADIAVTALGVNYRIGPDEASALRLLTTACIVDALHALVDWPTWLAAIEEMTNEKKDGVGSAEPQTAAADSTPSPSPGSEPGGPA